MAKRKSKKRTKKAQAASPRQSGGRFGRGGAGLSANGAPAGGHRAGSKEKRKKKRRSAPSRRAQELGIPDTVLRAARTNLERARAGLKGLNANERREVAAYKLGITVHALGQYEKACGKGFDGERREVSALLVRKAAGMMVGINPPPKYRSKIAASQSSRPGSTKRPKGQATGPKRKAKKKGNNVGEGPLVYVTTWGNVVHLYWDCHGVDAFPNGQAGDRFVYEVSIGDASCKGRTVCGKCRRFDDAKGATVNSLLRAVHGPPFNERKRSEQRWSRPKPSGRRIDPSMKN